MRNTIMSVRNCSKVDCRAMALYFYRLTQETDNWASHEEAQVLFNSLVKKLGLEKHYKKVLDSFIAKLVNQKKLTPVEGAENPRRNPWDYRGKVENHYREDVDCYDNCGQFSTMTLNDIDLIRCVFSGDEKNFSRIVCCTLLMEETEEEEFTIPKEIKPAAEFTPFGKDVSAVEFLKKSLELSDEETELLCCSFRTNAVKELYEFVNDLCRDNMDRIGVYATELDVHKKEVRKLLRNEGKLHSFGLIDYDGEFEHDAMTCIEAKDLNLYFADIIQKDKTKKTFPLESFAVKPEKTALLGRLLSSDSPANILFYGAPGAGKTEYAKAVARASGLTPLVFKNELEVKSEKNNEDSALYRLNCLLSVKQENSVIIVDEAETVLKTIGSFFGYKYSLPRKGTVNKMLESTSNKVIWILNYTNELDESTLRRFTYSHRFFDMPKNMLRSIAESKLKEVKMPASLKENILDLFGKYHVTGSSVDNMVKTVKGMKCTKENADSILKDVETVLESNSSLIFGKAKMRELVKDSYDLSVLNTSVPAEDMVDMIKSAVQYAEENHSEEAGVRMLFYGLSGTGKTELVRYLADKLNKKIILKRASDIMGKYVGENEKNIRAAFEEAEASDSILLFDEADSFFASRESATASWQRTQVNEFLTQMEEFNGILICTSNLRSIMDQALVRRFHVMAEFKPLKKSGIETLLGKFFTDYSFDSSDVEKIAAYETATPGDFGALSGRMRFIPKSKLSSAYIVNELCNLQKEKSGTKSIGFGA